MVMFKSDNENIISARNESAFLLSFRVPSLVQALPAVNFQLFAAEDEGRTEDPTEKRKREEREKGRVPRSNELPSALILLASFVVLYFTGEWALSGLANILQFFLGRFNNIVMPDSPRQLQALLGGLVWESGKIVLPVFATAVLFGIIGNVIQVGFLFSLKPMQFKWERIKPNFRKILFSMQTLVNLLKAISKIFFIAWMAYIIIGDDYYRVLKTSQVGLAESLKLLGWLAFKLIIIVAIILIILSVPDYIYQRYEFMESIKMSRQDLKQEYRETEGDVYIKQRQRERARELAQRNMLREVPKATVVITNPTHYAVALKYEQNIHEEPIVVAKGINAMAQKIIEIARNNEVEIRENAPLAQALYKSVDINQPIPESFFKIVVQVFRTLKKFQSNVGAVI
jgi:flagellar biosynthetic protein FlhB